MTSENHDQTSDQQALEALETQEGNLTAVQSKSFEQEVNADLAARGLKVVQEVHYQANLQSLIELTYEPIPNISDALFALLAPTAPGFSAGSLREGVQFFISKAANEAKKDLASKSDVDLPTFNFSKPRDTRQCYGKIKAENSGWLLGTKYTTHELDCAPGYSREPLSATGYLAHAPLFYVGRNGLLCNNWDVSTVVYTDNRKTLCNHDFMPNEFWSQTQNAYGMGQLFTGHFDREKLSQASIEIQILYYLWYIAANMVRSGAIMPQLIVNFEQRLQCRWIPAILSDKIKTLVTKVGLFLQGYEHLFLHRTDRTGPMDPLFLGQLMLSGFIHSYVSWCFLWYGKPLQLNQLEYRVLFSNYACPVNSKNIQESALQMRLESWLSPLVMGQQSFTPVLRFYDLDDPEVLNGSLFMVLSHDIYACADETKKNQQQAIRSLDESLARSIDLAQDRIEHNWDLDELAAADADVNADTKTQLIAHKTVHNLSMDDALKYSFDNTLGVGMELGFMGFDASITSNLYKRGLIDDSGIVSMALLLSEPCCESVRYECLRTASRLASIAEALNEVISAPKNICIVPLNKLYDVLQISSNALTLLGVKLILPRALSSLMRPTSRVRLDVETDRGDSRFEASHQSMMSLASALTFDWQLAIGEQRLSASEFKVLLANTGKIVRFHNQFVYADPEALLKIQKHLKNQQTLQANRAALLNAVFTGKLDENEVCLSPLLQKLIKEITTPVDIPEPKGLNATLRPYQKRGYEWLMHNLKVNIGSILADDMGLGKTLQVITALLKLKEEGQLDANNQALVIVPTSLITNWSREIKHFAPDLTVSAFHTMHSKNLSALNTDIVLTSYGVARSRIKDLTRQNYRLIIVDEAQAIKNRDTAVNKALRELRADYFIAMSGTPVENHLIEYYSILDFANRGLFGTVDSFRRSFATPIEKDRDMEAVGRFKSLTAPFILRRLKSDKNIISDLPDKVSSDQYCMLTPNQAALYETVVKETMRRLDEMENRQDRSSVVLTLVQHLRAICNSPAQYEKSEKNFKASDSGKVERLLELVDEITDGGGKALIFTQSVVMGKYLIEILREHTGHAPQFLHGELGIRERMDMVDRFQEDPNERFMLLSLRAAGTGLNLTAANYVIHFDLWWNPAVENQATDRAYRIGQKKKVQVYRFICANTFEERINDMINSKRELADMTVTQGETWIGDLSNRQLNELFSLSK